MALKSQNSYNKIMIKDFLILNCIGKRQNWFKIDNNFYIHEFGQKLIKKDQLVLNILNLIKKYKVNINE